MILIIELESYSVCIKVSELTALHSRPKPEFENGFG